MSFDLRAIHNGVADAIRGGVQRATGLDVKAFPFGSHDRPFIEIWPAPDYINYFLSMTSEGRGDINLLVHGELAVGDAETGFRWMTDLMSSGTGFDSSVPDALRADKTLGGVVEDCVPLEATWEVNDDGALVFEIPVRVIAKKTGGAA